MKLVKLECSDLCAMVDDEDYEKVSKYKWYALNKPHRIYARANASRVDGQPPRSIMMQWVVSGKWVDHKDRNGLNNTKENLRPCTSSQNSMNKKKQDGARSKYKGVSYDDRSSMWRARITFEGKTICLGRYKTEKEAAIAYDMAAAEVFQEFARDNSMGV